MDEKRLREIAAKLAKGIKTQEDLGKLTGFMNKMVIEMALNEEMAQHLNHEKHQKKRGSNTRNGYSKKTVISDDVELKLAISRDRESSFEPQLVKKHQTRINKINHQILFLYAKGMTKREIANTFKEMYDVDLSPTLISKVTDSVKEQVVEWQNRPLENLYPIVYLVCIVVKVKQDGSIVNKSVFLALAINVEGKRNYLAYGWQKIKVPNSGYQYSQNLKIGVLKIS